MSFVIKKLIYFSNIMIIFNTCSCFCISFFVQIRSKFDENENVINDYRIFNRIVSFIKQLIEILKIKNVEKNRYIDFNVIDNYM